MTEVLLHPGHLGPPGPSVIFISIPNDLRSQPPDSFPANRPFRPRRFVRTSKGRF